MNEKISSDDSKLDVRLPSFLPQICQVLMIKQGDKFHQLPAFRDQCSFPNS